MGKRKKLTIDEKLANAEKIVAGKKTNPNGRKLFEGMIYTPDIVK